MKKLLILLSIIFLMGFGPAKPDILRSIVQISYEEGLCTGFVVNAVEGRVLTAVHCLPKDYTQTPLYVEGRLSTVIKTSDSLALISSEPFVRPSVTVRKNKIGMGEGVQSFGYGYGKLTQIGRQIALWWDDDDLIMDGPILPGMSGGPIVDVSGNVVGINQATNNITSIGCGSDEILKFLKGK